MKGLLIKDFYTLRQYVKSVLLMMILFAFISMGMDNPATFIEGMFVMLYMMMTIHSFSYDALAKWDRFALSLPLTKRDIVRSKYLLSLILCLFGTIFSFLFASVLIMIKPVNEFGVMDHLLATAVIFSVAIFFSSVLIPITFQFGVEKSRIFMVGIFALPFASILVLEKLGFQMPSESTILTFAKLLPIVIIGIFIASYVISVKIYQNKEI